MSKKKKPPRPLNIDECAAIVRQMQTCVTDLRALGNMLRSARLHESVEDPANYLEGPTRECGYLSSILQPALEDLSARVLQAQKGRKTPQGKEPEPIAADN